MRSIINIMKKHMMWIVELFVWGLIIFTALFIGIYVHNADVRKNYTYYVFFKDVDGLIKGSPVKLQGYQVGYVSNISLVNDEVFVTFIITDKNFKMPKKMSATVEFTGMGGSKSLDLTALDSTDSSKNIITTIEPRRLQDFYIYGNQIAQNIVFATSGFTEMLNDRRYAQLQNLIKHPVFLKDTHNMLDKLNSSIPKSLKDWRYHENSF